VERVAEETVRELNVSDSHCDEAKAAGRRAVDAMALMTASVKKIRLFVPTRTYGITTWKSGNPFS
jgi:hypothetical protein